MSTTTRKKHKMSIAATVKQFCGRFDITYHAVNDSTILIPFKGGNARWLVVWEILGTRLICISLLPTVVPQEKQPQVMEYLTRANYGLPIGHFEMDLRDGEVRFVCSVDIADGELTQGMVVSLYFRNVVITDLYLTGLLRVLIADQEPSTAIRAIEEAAFEEGEEDYVPPLDGLSELLGDVNLDERQ